MYTFYNFIQSEIGCTERNNTKATCAHTKEKVLPTSIQIFRRNEINHSIGLFKSGDTFDLYEFKCEKNQEKKIIL